MFSRLVTTGIIVFSGVQFVAAADPLVPPAPGRDAGAPNVTRPAIPAPPAPQLNLQVAPIPESSAIPPITPPQPSIPQPSIPQSAPSVSPSGSDPYAVPPGSSFVPGRVEIAPPASSYSPAPVQPAPIQTAPIQSAPIQSAPGTITYGLQPDGSYLLSGDNVFSGSASYPGAPQYNSFSTGYDQQRYLSGPGGSEHARYPFYSYRRPWYSPGPVSRNVNIIW